MNHATKPYPLRFRPLIKQAIWGGRRLGERLGKPIGTAGSDAESWEVVDHGKDQSIVENGPLKGTSLARLVAEEPAWLLGSERSDKQFPLILKYLDCNRVLSVQVHPDDDYGRTLSPPDFGKTEAWYIVDAEPDSVIFAGLKAGVDRRMLAEAIHSGCTEETLHAFHPLPGDCVFIPAGTVHALGAGLLVAEIQQSSNTTFRLFDWNRSGADGRPRPLHIDAALEVTDYDSGPVTPRRVDRTQSGWQELVRCDKFVLRSLERGVETFGGDGRFHLVTVPQGAASLQTDGEDLQLARGDSVLLPAASGPAVIELSGDATALEMHRG